jgi:hypothetical protein
MMQRKNLLFGAGALLVAAGAIGAGVMVSSNAMAASGELGDHALTISMVSVGANGDAYQCTFDSASMPGLPSGADAGAGIVTSSVGGGVPIGATVVSGSGVISVATDGSLPPGLTPAPVQGTKGGVIAITGTANADGSSSVSQIAADGTVTPIELRPGTAAECAAAQHGVPATPIAGGPVTTDTVAADPKG